jgi:hypothetical protein
MSFTASQKVDIRRHAGYPAFGNVNSVQGGFQSFRFFAAYGELEFRMNNMAPEEETVVLNYVTELNTLETDIFGTRTNLDIKKAAVYEANPQEQLQREALYASFRRKLCAFLGVPAGPGLGVSGNSATMVV